jgi:hypothetical protein
MKMKDQRAIQKAQAKLNLEPPQANPLQEFLAHVTGKTVRHICSGQMFIAEAVEPATKHKPARVFCRPLLPGMAAAHVPAGELMLCED